MAVRTTFLSALRAWLAAPEPRPPQPINPTRSVSVFSRAKSCPGISAGAASALPTRAEVLRKSRREVRLFDGVFMIKRYRAIEAENSSQVNPENGTWRRWSSPPLSQGMRCEDGSCPCLLSSLGIAFPLTPALGERVPLRPSFDWPRSEEHTSELQS